MSERYGQALFNNAPNKVTDFVVTTDLDPFYSDDPTSAVCRRFELFLLLSEDAKDNDDLLEIAKMVKRQIPPD